MKTSQDLLKAEEMGLHRGRWQAYGLTGVALIGLGTLQLSSTLIHLNQFYANSDKVLLDAFCTIQEPLSQRYYALAVLSFSIASNLFGVLSSIVSLVNYKEYKELQAETEHSKQHAN